MGIRVRLLLLMGIMGTVAAVVGLLGIRILYGTAFEGQKERLSEFVRNQALLIRAMARHEHEGVPGDNAQQRESRVLAQLREAHGRFTGFGESGEYLLGRREGDRISFLLRFRHDGGAQQPVLLPAHVPQPMDLALRGRTGCDLLPDYRGVEVLAAYGPVGEFGWGLVAKIDREEVQAPFVRAGIVLGLVSCLAVAVGALLFLRITAPIASEQDRALAERRQAQDEARAGENRLRTVLDTAADGIITIDAAGTILSFNPAAERLFGYGSGEVLGRNIKILMPEPYHGEHDGYLANYLRTGVRKIIGIGREVQGLRKDGSTFPLFIAVGEARIDGERVFSGIVRDLTEIKEMERKVQQGKTLATIGEMAAQVAHEIKNPLAAISGAVQVFRQGLAAGDDRREILDQVVDQTKRLDRSLRDLLMFARPWIAHRRPCDLRETARQVASMTGSEEGFAGVSFEIDESGDARVQADPALVEQVLWNLAQNAQQAMPRGGTIRISFEPGPRTLAVRVTDSGEGIPAPVLEKVLEPFFTTKTRGTGLGLPICKRILEAHGGTLAVESRPGAGTTVTLTFPR